MLKISGYFQVKLKFFSSIFTFSLCTKKIISLIGESGSGKSTFLKCISGLILPYNSYLSVNEILFQDSTTNFFIKPHLRRIGYVFQQPYLYPYMNVFENITFAFRKNIFGFDVQGLINFLNLSKIKKRCVENLSGGEKQRVSIAQVLLSNPNLVLLDEVLSNQDLNMKIKLISLFKSLNERNKMSFIYVSHEIKSLYLLSDFVIYINKGKLVFLSD